MGGLGRHGGSISWRPSGHLVAAPLLLAALGSCGGPSVPEPVVGAPDGPGADAGSTQVGANIATVPPSGLQAAQPQAIPVEAPLGTYDYRGEGLAVFTPSQLSNSGLTSGRVVIDGYVTLDYRCPPCPPDFMCERCLDDHVEVADGLRPSEWAPLPGTPVYLAPFREPLAEGRHYRLVVELGEGLNTGSAMGPSRIGGILEAVRLD